MLMIRTQFLQGLSFLYGHSKLLPCTSDKSLYFFSAHDFLQWANILPSRWKPLLIRVVILNRMNFHAIFMSLMSQLKQPNTTRPVRSLNQITRTGRSPIAIGSTLTLEA